MHMLPKPDLNAPLGYIKVEPNNHGSENHAYISNSGYTIPATAKHNAHDHVEGERLSTNMYRVDGLIVPKNLYKETTLKESEKQYRNFYNEMKNFIEDERLVLAQAKEGERNVNLYINTTIAEGTPYTPSRVYIPRESSNILVTFGLQKGNIYNLPYLILANLVGEYDNALRTPVDKHKGSYSLETLQMILKQLDDLFRQECLKENFEYTSEVFANLLFIARNIKIKSLTKDVSLWIDGLKENYTQDELWFALSDEQVKRADGKTEPGIVHEYRTYLYLLKG